MSVAAAGEFAYAAVVLDFVPVVAAVEKAASVVVVAVSLKVVVAVETAVAAAVGCSNNIATCYCIIDCSAHFHIAH